MTLHTKEFPMHLSNQLSSFFKDNALSEFRPTAGATIRRLYCLELHLYIISLNIYFQYF